MMKDDACPMFDLNLMDFFYNPDYENDTNVINAWYVYVLKILTIVSKKWRDATAPEKLSNEKSMFSFISISDEALMRWLLIIWVSNLANKNPKEPNRTDGNKENLEENEKNMPSKKNGVLMIQMLNSASTQSFFMKLVGQGVIIILLFDGI